MESIRKAFAEHFGEDNTARIEAAAEDHANGINDQNKGSDPFKWVLLIALGYQCMEIPAYREHHRITADWLELKQWIKDHADLGEHDGDCDMLAAIVGTYNEYIPAAVQEGASNG